MARMTLFVAITMALGAVACVSDPSSAQTCASMDLVRNSGKDATPALTECIGKMAGKGALRLSAGTYQLLTPLVIDRTVTIETASPPSGPACSRDTGANCAVMAIGQMQAQPTAGVMPIEVSAPDVRFRSMAIVGKGDKDAAWQRSICLDPHSRPLGGAVRVRADNFEMANVLLKGTSCYTALEIVKGVKGVALNGNVIGPNGNHKIKDMWSDGVTVHDATNAVIENNIFQDNTDVQLIFGGCVACRIAKNRFIHSGDVVHASFAELMLHAWPDTSGNFAGSVTSGNSIDCGANRRCGYGIMIGGEPWYPSRASGGTVSGNRVNNALMGVNVDKLTGPMDIGDNIVANSGGTAKSDCGTEKWPAINISPDSQKFVLEKIAGFASIKTSRCLLNR
ncbi:MAG: right-handed parallel beta-helix repeat-containing protein [Sphingobium yanoikuyae]